MAGDFEGVLFRLLRELAPQASDAEIWQTVAAIMAAFLTHLATTE